MNMKWLTQVQVKSLGYELGDISYAIQIKEEPEDYELRLLEIAQSLFDFVESVVLAFGRDANTPEHLVQLADAMFRASLNKEMKTEDVIKAVENYDRNKKEKSAHMRLRGNVELLKEHIQESNKQLASSLKSILDQQRVIELALEGMTIADRD